MAEIVVMPRMNLTTESCLLACWYKNPGDAVAPDEPLCSVEDDKVATDLQSPAAGVIVKVWATVGEKYAVGMPLCLIATAGEDVSALIAQAEERLADLRQPAGRPQVETTHEEAVAGGFRILPKARGTARRHGVTIEELKAHYGNMNVSDGMVEQYAAQRVPIWQIGPGRRVKLSPMRRAIFDAMTASCHMTARLTNFIEVDMTAATYALEELKRKGGDVSLTALIVKACAIALREHAVINTAFDEASDEIVYLDEINIGFAIDIPNGLVVPVIKNAIGKTLAEITGQVHSFTQRAREGTLTTEDMAGGTFTVSNVGMLGIESFTPLIRYPEAAILGVGEIKTLPRYAGDDYSRAVPRKIMIMGLTYDHRVIDGAPASRLLVSVKKLLEEANFCSMFVRREKTHTDP